MAMLMTVFILATLISVRVSGMPLSQDTTSGEVMPTGGEG